MYILILCFVDVATVNLKDFFSKNTGQIIKYIIDKLEVAIVS